MKHAFDSAPVALKLMFKDPINLFLVLVPAIIATFLYGLLGKFIFGTSLEWGHNFITERVVHPDVGAALYYILIGVLMFFLFLVINWTFVIVIGIIASPFNEMLSSRIEKKLCGKINTSDRSIAISEMFKNLAKTIINEVKKLSIILILAILALVLSYIPFLFPVGLILTSLLLAIQFLDYSWSRHNFRLSAIFTDVFRNFFTYTLMGLFFLLLVVIPVVNAFVPALGTAYFTVLWIQRNNLKQN